MRLPRLEFDQFMHRLRWVQLDDAPGCGLGDSHGPYAASSTELSPFTPCYLIHDDKPSGLLCGIVRRDEIGQSPAIRLGRGCGGLCDRHDQGLGGDDPPAVHLVSRLGAFLRNPAGQVHQHVHIAPPWRTFQQSPRNQLTLVWIGCRLNPCIEV